MRRKKGGHDGGHGGEEAWVIPYADLITLLLGLFILLYASADANTTKMESLARGLADAFNVGVNEGDLGSSFFEGGTGIIPERNSAGALDFDLDQIRRLIEERAVEAGVQGQILVSRDDDRIVIRLADNLVFPSASADIRLQALPLLEIVAAAVNGSDNEIRVEGHTDNIPLATEKYPSNWELSAARATSVLRLLIEELGVDPARVFAVGYGEFRPIASNLTPEGRALNRRADIVLLYPSAAIEPDATQTNTVPIEQSLSAADDGPTSGPGASDE